MKKNLFRRYYTPKDLDIELEAKLAKQGNIPANLLKEMTK
jgi:hypothetical protein